MSQEENSNKTAFARALLRSPHDAFAAAQTVFPDDTGRAAFAARYWTTDAFVKNEMERLCPEVALEKEQALNGLPSKEEYALSIWELAQSARVPEDRIKALTLFGDVMGYRQKGGITVNNSVETPKVMVVKDHGTDDDWERKVLEQQERLRSVN